MLVAVGTKGKLVAVGYEPHNKGGSADDAELAAYVLMHSGIKDDSCPSTRHIILKIKTWCSLSLENHPLWKQNLRSTQASFLLKHIFNSKRVLVLSSLTWK